MVMGKVRHFRDYVNARGENEIRSWLDGIPSRARAKIQARITFLETARELQRPYIASLTGECDGLLEIRAEVGKVQYRPLACHGPGEQQVTLLLGATEKGGKFVPARACETALERRGIIETTDGRTCEHDFR